MPFAHGADECPAAPGTPVPGLPLAVAIRC